MLQQRNLRLERLEERRMFDASAVLDDVVWIEPDRGEYLITLAYEDGFTTGDGDVGASGEEVTTATLDPLIREPRLRP